QRPAPLVMALTRDFMFSSTLAEGHIFKKFRRALSVSDIFFLRISKYLFRDGEHSLGREPDDRQSTASQASRTSPVKRSSAWATDAEPSKPRVNNADTVIFFMMVSYRLKTSISTRRLV